MFYLCSWDIPMYYSSCPRSCDSDYCGGLLEDIVESRLDLGWCSGMLSELDLFLLRACIFIPPLFLSLDCFVCIGYWAVLWCWIFSSHLTRYSPSHDCTKHTFLIFSLSLSLFSWWLWASCRTMSFGWFARLSVTQGMSILWMSLMWRDS